jgi:hypothetical protein
MIGADFITAGRAVFTLSGKANRFTYKVTRKDAEPGSRYGNQPTFFVSLLNGPDNTSDYCYLGVLDTATGYVRLTKKSRMGIDAPSVKALHWALPKLWAKAPMPPSFEIRHEGKCGRCGRALTVPESIDSGFGPECCGKMGIDWQKNAKPVSDAPRGELFDVAFEA